MIWKSVFVGNGVSRTRASSTWMAEPAERVDFLESPTARLVETVFSTLVSSLGPRSCYRWAVALCSCSVWGGCGEGRARLADTTEPNSAAGDDWTSIA